MGTLLGKTFRCILAVLLAPLVAAFLVTTAEVLVQTYEGWLQSWFTIGFVASFPVWVALMASGNSFIEYLEHELGHVTIVKILGRGVKQLEVTPYEPVQKGRVEWRKDAGCLGSLILLAPYFLPLFTIPFLVVQPFVGQSLQNVLNAIIGVTYSFHVVGLGFEFGRHQTDITDTGLFFSLAITGLFNAIILVIIVSVVMGDLAVVADYFALAFERTQQYYRDVVDVLQSLLAQW